MSYEFNKSDVYDLARQLNAETKQKGSKELEFKYCPYCRGGDHNDRNTFSISLETGQFKCLRGSCNKQGGFITLARDLNIFKEYYNVKEITLVDMFPNTYHCESIAVIERRNNVERT